MLEHIKANVTKQCDQNEAAAEKLRGLLKGFEAKLKDLDKALKDAVELLKKANTQNGLSAQALADLQVNNSHRSSVMCVYIRLCICFINKQHISDVLGCGL